MKIALTLPTNGAGRFIWSGYANAFKALGHDVYYINNSSIFRINPDLLICSTSIPSQEHIDWREKNKHKKIALNTLCWTDEPNLGMEIPGIQASQGNIEYAKKLRPDLIFAHYSQKYIDLLLANWRDKEGYKLGSFMLAADSTVYPAFEHLSENYKYDIVYAGGFWPYKSKTIVPWLLPVIRKYRRTSILIGGGWPIQTDGDCTEYDIGKMFGIAKVTPNIHEYHGNKYGYDIIERCFKTPFCGGLLVSDYVKEMEDVGFKSGHNCFLANSTTEYAEMIDAIIQDPTKYSHIRKNGALFIKEKHTYIHRAIDFLKQLEL